MTSHDCGADSYVLKNLDGWNVCMDSVLFDGTDLGDRAESALLADIQHVEGLLESTVFDYLREKTNIYVEKDSTWPIAVFHPRADWLTSNGFPSTGRSQLCSMPKVTCRRRNAHRQYSCTS